MFAQEKSGSVLLKIAKKRARVQRYFAIIQILYTLMIVYTVPGEYRRVRDRPLAVATNENVRRWELKRGKERVKVRNESFYLRILFLWCFVPFCVYSCETPKQRKPVLRMKIWPWICALFWNFGENYGQFEEKMSNWLEIDHSRQESGKEKRQEQLDKWIASETNLCEFYTVSFQMLVTFFRWNVHLRTWFLVWWQTSYQNLSSI